MEFFQFRRKLQVREEICKIVSLLCLDKPHRISICDFLIKKLDEMKVSSIQVELSLRCMTKMSVI